MSKVKLIASFGVAIIFVLLLTAYIVPQTQYALKLRFGKVISVADTAGLHFKVPLMDKIRFFDKRILTLDAEPQRFLTSEKKSVIVDSFVKWRIISVTDYYTTLGGSETRAGQRLSEIIADSLRGKFGIRTIKEVVSGERADIMVDMRNEANERTKSLGIKIEDVRIKRIDLPEEVSHSVYRRMEAERERVARDLRSRGQAEAIRIRAAADRKKVELLAEAQRKSEELRGNGDGEASKIYAESYGKNPEFYNLYRSLNAYKKTFSDKSDVLVIEPDSEFFQYFKKSQ